MPALVILAALLVIALVFPILAFVRSSRLLSEVGRLRSRIDALERRLAPGPAAGVRPQAASHVQAQPSTAAPAIEPATPLSSTPLSSIPSAPLAPPGAPPLHPERDLLRALVADASDADLEERIGGRWLQHAGMVVLVLGVAFFLRYAFEREWLSPAVRVALGAVAGSGMVGGGLRLSRGYRRYGLFLSGGGLAVLYLSVYAGLNLYNLFGPAIAFGSLVVISAAAAILADRTESIGLALMAVCGGFAAPFLVGSGRDEQRTLFSYVALLVAATMYLAHRRSWLWLNVVSLALTTITVLAWADRFYTPAKYLRTELFLTLYCAMFILVLRTAWQRAPRDAALMTPLLLAPVGYHVASVLLLAPHGIAFLVYLICVTLLTVLAGANNPVAGHGAGAGPFVESSLLRAIGWAAVALPLGGWIGTHRSGTWLVAVVTTIAAIFIVHAAAQVRHVAQGGELDERDVALLHANGVGVFAALYEVLIDHASIDQLALFALALAAANVAIWGTLRRSGPLEALHWLGVAMTLTAIAIWLQLGGPWAIATWATEGAVVFWIGSAARREWVRAGAWLLLALAIFRWLQPDIQDTTTSFELLLNARALSGIYLIFLLYVAAWMQHRHADASEPRRRSERATLIVTASVLTLVVVSREIMSFWEIRPEAFDAAVAREVMISAAWVIYAAILVVIGMRLRYPPVRYFAIALFGVSLAKVFLVDLQTLGGIYRVAGFLLIGLILLVVSFLYQRANIAARPSD